MIGIRAPEFYVFPRCKRIKACHDSFFTQHPPDFEYHKVYNSEQEIPVDLVTHKLQTQIADISIDECLLDLYARINQTGLLGFRPTIDLLRGKGMQVLFMKPGDLYRDLTGSSSVPYSMSVHGI